jgi:hypothetical protein
VEDRVDYIEVTPSVSRLAHARIVSFLLVLLVRRAAVMRRGGGACARAHAAPGCRADARRHGPDSA